MTIISNKLGQSTTLHVNANTTLVVAGNNSVSNIASASETVVSANIRRIWTGGACSISRGANVVFTSTQSGYFGFADHGAVLSMDSTANVVISMTGTSFVMIELSKQSDKVGSQ